MDSRSPLTEAYSADLAFAVGLAERAGGVLRAHYGQLEHIEDKGHGDVVTEADFRSEALIIGAIQDRYPGDRILAEESGEHDPLSADGTASDGRVWVVDPLDGTINYANGIPVFSVSIALVVDGSPVTGVVLDPLRHECFAATASGEATLGGRGIHTTSADAARDLVLRMSNDHDIGGVRAAGFGRGLRTRWLGSAALELSYVANGRFGAFIQSRGLSNWDIAAAGLIAERGGATLTSMDGGPWFDAARPAGSVGLIASPPANHAALLEAMRPGRPPSGS